MSSENRIHHVNLMVEDLEAAVAFYTGVLGLERAPTPELGFPAQFVRINDQQEIHLNRLPGTVPERAHFCLRVGDFEGVYARAKAAGVVDTATWGHARRLPSGVVQVFVRDPSGNLIEISCEAEQAVDPAIFDDEVFQPAES